MTASPLPRLHTHSEGSADTHSLTGSIGSSHILDPLTGGTDVRRQTDIFTHVVVPDSHSKHREAHTGHSDTHKPIDTGTPDRTCWLACTHTPQPQSSHRHTHTHTHTPDTDRPHQTFTNTLAQRHPDAHSQSSRGHMHTPASDLTHTHRPHTGKPWTSHTQTHTPDRHRLAI